MRICIALLTAAMLLSGCGEEPARDANDAGVGSQGGETASPPAADDSAGETAQPVPSMPANAAAPKAADPAPPKQALAGACLTQDGKAVPANRLRAVGTEPFWGARIEGRCVTYSHPEDQQGTRVWTRFSGTANNGSWTGSLNGSPFVLRTRPQPSCSDGMSDNRYPIAVALTVGGEQRTGCAQPL